MRKKKIQHFFIGDFGGVENDLDRFGVTGRTGANFLVSRIFGAAAGVANCGLENPGDFAQNLLHSPKAATRESRNLMFRFAHNQLYTRSKS